MKKTGWLLTASALVVFSFSLSSLAATWYVATNGTGDGSTWANATNSIQGAVDRAAVSDSVWVSNGVYSVGGVTNWPAGSILTNRVAITKAITVRSAGNDPEGTIIQGAWDPYTTNGPAAVRCVYMVNHANLIGFTLIGGATLRTNDAAASVGNNCGGGVCAESTLAVVSNCIIRGNAAFGERVSYGGGGAFRGRLLNSTLNGNHTPYKGGGASYAILSNCTVLGNTAGAQGGGIHQCTAYTCSIISNAADSAAGIGGGARESHVYNSTLSYNTAGFGGGAFGEYTASNCVIFFNRAVSYGGAAYYGTFYNCLAYGNYSASLGGGMSGPFRLYNCTVVGNKAANGGGGIYSVNAAAVIYNSIVYSNEGAATPNWGNHASVTNYFTNSCTYPAAGGWAANNITNNPLLRDFGSGYGTNHIAGNYGLAPSSPCVNSGLNQGWMTNACDLHGQPRIRYGTVDMGALELLYGGTIYRVR